MPKIIYPPVVCRYCGSKVELVTGDIIYKSSTYANKNFYRCTECFAFVGCHQNTKKPLGILANNEERELRKKCHFLFDKQWRQDLQRKDRYVYLAERMGIATHNCHIAYFDKKRVLKAIQLMNDDIDSSTGLRSSEPKTDNF